MMKSSLLATSSSETTTYASSLMDTAIECSPPHQAKTPPAVRQHLPGLLPTVTTPVPDSFIGLFWQMAGIASTRIKTFVQHGMDLWAEAFGAMTSVQQLEEYRANNLIDATTGQASSVFRLKQQDVAVSLVSSLISQRRLNTSVESFPQADREGWLTATPWVGVDDLFPTTVAQPVEPIKIALDVVPLKASTVAAEVTPCPVDIVEDWVVVVPPEAAIKPTTILGALHEAYPITTPEEAECLSHPLIQRGREVKSSINELVDAYFASEAITTD
jgi:hypothetical protein